MVSMCLWVFSFLILSWGLILFFNLYVSSGIKSEDRCLFSKTVCNTEPHSPPDWANVLNTSCFLFWFKGQGELAGDADRPGSPEHRCDDFWSLHTVVVILQKLTSKSSRTMYYGFHRVTLQKVLTPSTSNCDLPWK